MWNARWHYVSSIARRDFQAWAHPVRLYGTMSSEAIFLLMPSIHPTRFSASPCVLPLFSSLFCPVARFSSRAPFFSSSSSSMPSGYLHLLCLRVVCPSRVPGVIFIAAVREARDAWELPDGELHGALPVLLLSHFSLPSLCAWILLPAMSASKTSFAFRPARPFFRS